MNGNSPTTRRGVVPTNNNNGHATTDASPTLYRKNTRTPSPKPKQRQSSLFINNCISRMKIHQPVDACINNNNNDPTSSRIRRLLEPMAMSLVTVILLFHWQFFTENPAATQAAAVLDVPPVSLPLVVKRRFPHDPPPYDYHAKLPKDTAVPIFFHVYLPHDSKKRGKALRIVTEQLDALQQSEAPQLTRVTIFYQTIGKLTSSLNSAVIQALCKERNFKCRHLGQYDDGREELTLHHVQQFCHADATNNNNNALVTNTTRRVMYIHNKGSHHTSAINDRWRNKMMAAMTHEKCLAPPMEVCTLCSLFLTAERGIFVAGNFWIARCDYLTQLLPPLQFEGHMEHVVKDALYMQLESRINMGMHKQWPPSFGTGRFAAEYWSGSHPTVIPCDFSLTFRPQPIHADNTLDFLAWVNNTSPKVVAKPLRWTMAPKHPIKIPQASIRENEQVRLLEYFLLPGNILRWYALYNTVPGEFSWVWAWFPDGRKWRNAIRKHGKNAVAEMTKGLEKEGYT
ncbi:expressed unknown protein [Seminavis robusta]|uniref:Uncharacterized protein n=1 Tax=Seminavis robusta TaxID=568900 RepID=A0A9N8HAF2_9STRA|nr:expressed unknown protein [Seminavis robusta]|eukprot:Sro222_g091160.1 n/a (512) ;mRNA; f:32146-33681